MLEGQWRGDTDLFRTQAFGEYVIELVEDGTRIGTTDGAVYGIRYHWGAEQTRETLYVTRQPSTNESWTVALYVGESRFDPLATQEGTQSAAENVFEVDLTELDLESGQYSWELLVGEGLQLERTHFISLTPSSGDLLIP
jgi:predicted secreted protein